MYLVMELMDTSLQAHLYQHSPLRLPRASALQMALQIAQGLRHLHENQVCHRDLKPLNILLSFERGEHEPILKLADFGLSRSTNELSSMTAVVGTIQYMAPGDARMSSCYRTRACISLSHQKSRASFAELLGNEGRADYGPPIDCYHGRAPTCWCWRRWRLAH